MNKPGLFDLLMQQQMQAGGYSPFDPGPIMPPLGPGYPMQVQNQQQPSLRPRYNAGARGGGVTGAQVAGNPVGAAGYGIGALIKKGIDAYRSRKPEVQLGNAQDRAIQTALDSKAARIMKENPGISPREAIVAAAQELYASTSGSQQDPAFRDQIRNQAMQVIANMGEFDPEAQKQFSEAKLNNRKAVEPEDLGPLKSFRGPDGRTLTVPEKQAARFLAENPFGLEMVDTPSQPQPGDTITSWVGGQKLTRTYDPTGKITGLQPNEAGYVTESGDARAAAGGPAEGPDLRTDTELSKASADMQNSLAAFQSINYAIDDINKISLEAESKGIAGTTGLVGKAYQILGEASGVISAAGSIASNIVKAEGTKTPYAGGTMSYGDLVKPSNYEEEFKHFKFGHTASARVQASLINLAYMLAIAEEKSARAISDNDIKLRLRTLGADMSAGKGLRQILEDRRRNAYYNMKSRLENDILLGSDPKYSWYGDRLEAIAKPYNITKEAEPTGVEHNAVPTIQEPEIIIGPDGKVITK